MRYSIIVPVYNRPDEVDELLESLTAQTLTDFEVIIVEDGSSLPCQTVCGSIITTNPTPDPARAATMGLSVPRASILSCSIRMSSCLPAICRR